MFDLIDGDVKVKRALWHNFGDTPSWLASDAFGLLNTPEDAS